MDVAALILSVELAGLTTVILLVLGLPIAWWLTTSRWRARFLVEAVVALPLVLPPTVLGFYLLTGLGPRSPAGRLFAAAVGHPFPFSFAGLLVASVLYSLPFAVQPFAAAMAGVDRRLVEASHTLGVSRLGTFAGSRCRSPGQACWPVRSWPSRTRSASSAWCSWSAATSPAGPAPSPWPSSTTWRRWSTAPRTGRRRLLLAVSFVVLALVYALQRRPFLGWGER